MGEEDSKKKKKKKKLCVHEESIIKMHGLGKKEREKKWRHITSMILYKHMIDR